MNKIDSYNRIRIIIKNPRNNHRHLKSIGNLVRNFERVYGVCNLSMGLNQLKKGFIEELGSNKRALADVLKGHLCPIEIRPFLKDDEDLLKILDEVIKNNYNSYV